MARFRKKPLEIDAVQFEGGLTSAHTVWKWAKDNGTEREISVSDTSVSIKTLEGTMRAAPGDWIIRGVKGELYPCKPDIFEQTYELAD